MPMTRLRRAAASLLGAASGLAFLMLASGPASAQTLTEALTQAYSSNPQLLAERARLRATDEELNQANAGWRPRVSVNGGLSRTDDQISGAEVEGWQASVTATQPLYEGGRVGAQRDLAKSQIAAGRASLRNVEAQVLLGVVTAYMDVVRDQEALELARRQVELLERQRQAAQDRFDVGEVTRTDVAQAEARLSGARTGLISAEAQLTASRAAFASVVGAPPQNLERDPRLPPLPDSQAAALEAALASNAQLAAAQAGAQGAEAAVALAQSALLPNVNLTAEYSRGESSTEIGPLTTNRDTDSTTIGIGANVPLYQGGAEWSAIRQAKQTLNQNRLLVAQAERQVAEAISDAWNGLVAATSAIDSASQQVTASEIAAEGVRQEADVGSRTTLDVLNAEQELLNARVTLVQNRRNRYVAAYSLLAAMGQLNAETLGLGVEIYDPTIHADDVAGKLIGVGADE